MVGDLCSRPGKAVPRNRPGRFGMVNSSSETPGGRSRVFPDELGAPGGPRRLDQHGVSESRSSRPCRNQPRSLAELMWPHAPARVHRASKPRREAKGRLRGAVRIVGAAHHQRRARQRLCRHLGERHGLPAWVRRDPGSGGAARNAPAIGLDGFSSSQVDAALQPRRWAPGALHARPTLPRTGLRVPNSGDRLHPQSDRGRLPHRRGPLPEGGTTRAGRRRICPLRPGHHIPCTPRLPPETAHRRHINNAMTHGALGTYCAR